MRKYYMHNSFHLDTVQDHNEMNMLDSEIFYLGPFVIKVHFSKRRRRRRRNVGETCGTKTKEPVQLRQFVGNVPLQVAHDESHSK